ncbi:hypothetical protein D9M68_660450 [compost metagenome]
MNELKRFRTCEFPLVLALALTGCGGGGSAGSAAALTPHEQLAQLEATGVLPALDRGDSVAGIDANANGVRDDIERHIEKKYTVSAERAAAMQMARAHQQMLLVDKSNEIALDRVSGGSFRAIVCLGSTFAGPDASNSSLVRTEIRALTTNTKERLLAYLAYNKARSGSVSRLPEGETCE